MAKKIIHTQTAARPKFRNWLAVHAQFRKAGSHGDRKKDVNRKACRGRVREGEGS